MSPVQFPTDHKAGRAEGEGELRLLTLLHSHSISLVHSNRYKEVCTSSYNGLRTLYHLGKITNFG